MDIQCKGEEKESERERKREGDARERSKTTAYMSSHVQISVQRLYTIK